jgi:hypothetical protein
MQDNRSRISHRSTRATTLGSNVFFITQFTILTSPVLIVLRTTSAKPTMHPTHPARKMEILMRPRPQSRLAAVIGSVLLALNCSLAFADGYPWRRGYKPRTLISGPLVCYQKAGCQDQQLNCKWEDQPLFDADAFADYIAASDNRRYIVGLTNRGSVPLFWLRDFHGELIYSGRDSSETWGPDLPATSHEPVIHFCRASVTNVREWFNEQRPEVKFEFEGDKLLNVTMRGCDGKTLLFRMSE